MRRVPILAVIPLCVGAVALPWWLRTKHMDFTVPPGEAQLERIRQVTKAALAKPLTKLPAGRHDHEARAVQSPIKPPPVIDPGDPRAPATLDAFREHAGKGAAAFIELAAHLEEQSGNARALLAWERVLDACRPDPSQRDAAMAGIRRLRPLIAPWNVDPDAAKPLVLEVRANRPMPVENLEGQLEEAARVLGHASSGLLRFESRLEIPEPPQPPKKGRGKAAKQPPPAALPEGPPTLSFQLVAEGDKKSSASTGVIEILVPEDRSDFRREILRACYKLAASQLAATTDFTPPEPLSADEDPAVALAQRITRLSWSAVGKSLQPRDRP